jgi:hypothetical protein
MDPLFARLMHRTNITGDGCWLWTGATDRHGYGKVKYAGRTEQVHRIAYKVLGPDFDHALTLDHTCRRLTCWNFEHLDPVTQRVNNSRNPDHPSNRTHCPAGHEYTNANTYRHPRGERVCRRCRGQHVEEPDSSREKVLTPA